MSSPVVKLRSLGKPEVDFPTATKIMVEAHAINSGRMKTTIGEFAVRYPMLCGLPRQAQLGNVAVSPRAAWSSQGVPIDGMVTLTLKADLASVGAALLERTSRKDLGRWLVLILGRRVRLSATLGNQHQIRTRMWGSLTVRQLISEAEKIRLEQEKNDQRRLEHARLELQETLERFGAL